MRFVTGRSIDMSKLMATVTSPERGGTAAFVGSVRRSAQDGQVARIVYSAYEEMVEAEFERIIRETHDQFPGARVTGIHRVGSVPVGEASIVVVSAAPHRDEAFAACRHAVEQAKKRLPVWKKEFFEDGTERWRENPEWASPSS
jgi:molybdopterin synthase catalytic subunit